MATRAVISRAISGVLKNSSPLVDVPVVLTAMS
jgi:hypothetical protein